MPWSGRWQSQRHKQKTLQSRVSARGRVMDLDHLPPGMVTAHQKILIIDNILSFMHIETSSATACFGQTPQAGCSSVASFEHQEMQGAVNVLGFH